MLKKFKTALGVISALSVMLSSAVFSAEGTSRVEFLRMLTEKAGVPGRIYEGGFSDVARDDIYSDMLQGAYNAKIVDGGEFNADEGITREEAVAMAVKSLIYKKAEFPVLNGELSFSDAKEISPQYAPYVEAAVSGGLIADGGKLNPKSVITEAEAEALLSKLDVVYEALPLDLGDAKKTNEVNGIRSSKNLTETAKGYYESAMKKIINGGLENEIKRADEELAIAYGAVNKERSSIMTGSYIFDDNDGLIQAHGGNVIRDEKTGKYYWYGEARKPSKLPEHLQKYGDWGWRTGVGCYSSDDLYNWKYEGLALEMLEEEKAPDYPLSDISLGRVIERPKVIYNKKTDKYVMWMHIDNGWYGYSRAGVAVSDSPTGPFRYIESFRPGDKMARDMTVFADDDGQAYIYFSTDENGCLACCRLSDDYLKPVGDAEYCIWWKWREAPAVFRYKDTYYMITSGCTGWDANEADYATAPSPMGPWTQHGNPCVGEGANKTFGGQSYWVMPIDAEAGKFIFMADIWRPSHHSESGYIWLPIQLQPDGSIRIEWIDEWTLEELDNRIVEPEPIISALGDELRLPKTIEVIENGKAARIEVEWDGINEKLIGRQTVTGVLKNKNKSPISVEVYQIPENVKYFADCGGVSTKDYDVVASAGNKLFNSVPDKEAGVDEKTGKSWGYRNDNGGGSRGDVDMFYSLRFDKSDGGKENVGTGIHYDFEADSAKKYDVYVAVFDPWGEPERYVDIKVQGAYKAKDYKTADGAAVFLAESITAENGKISVEALRSELSLEPQLDPVISWIMIAEAE